MKKLTSHEKLASFFNFAQKAIQNGKNEKARELIEKYPDIVLIEDYSGHLYHSTLFASAIGYKNIEMIEFFFEKKTPIPFSLIAKFLIDYSLAIEEKTSLHNEGQIEKIIFNSFSTHEFNTLKRDLKKLQSLLRYKIKDVFPQINLRINSYLEKKMLDANMSKVDLQEKTKVKL